MKSSDELKTPLGLGCWPIGGAMYSAEGSTLGYSNSNDKESIRTIHAALDCGIQLFDTAAAYGAGHAERLLGDALKGKPDVIVVTKIGIGIDETSKKLTGEQTDPAAVMPAIDKALARLQRDRIDLLLLHLNDLAVDQATLIFDEMETARRAGKIQAYGWSTDFTSSAAQMTDRPGFVAIEHAMNVLTDAPKMQSLVESNQWQALNRSPLAMGLLSGKYKKGQTMPHNDIRSTKLDWMEYYCDSQPNPDYLQRFDNVRELLQTAGRTPAQGALAWLWAKSTHNIPIPGARTVEQIEGLAGAIELGPLPTSVMSEIELHVQRENDWSEDMAR